MIPVIWHSETNTNGRGRYNCTSMLNEMFDRSEYDCVHYGSRKGQIGPIDGGVIVVHGGREPNDLDRLNEDISKLQWCLLIFLGDEECLFPAERVEHKNMIAWVQEPLLGRHDFAKRFLINGYPHYCKQHLVRCEKDLDWVLHAQITHERRRACRDALQRIPTGGIIVETKGFCQGVSRPEYFRLYGRAKIAPCPSGPCSQDSARVWEAIEAGCLPILDDLSPRRIIPGFWQYVLGDHPFPVVTDWSVLPSLIEELKPRWEERVVDVQLWWEAYKADFWTWLGKDVEILRGA